MKVDEPSTSDHEAAIARLLRDWGLWRDTARWEELRQSFAPNARMKTTWFDGTAEDFVDASMRASATGAQVLHAMGPSTIHIRADRAIAETRVTLLLRDQLDGVEIDVTCYGRFIDLLVKRSGRWALLTRTPIYEKDCLVPSRPGRAPQLDESALAKYPSGYRHLAYLQSRRGATVQMDIPAHNSDQQRQLYQASWAWLENITDAS
ncbi:MAG: nuclear transport factor 2 family protein [Pseudomonadota bacterium]|nr:nuclear transport factor 2 family protein [Pseudomonadota bacterium]